MINFKVAQWGKREWFSAMQCLCLFDKFSSKAGIDKLKQLLEKETNADAVYLVNSARAGIEVSLQWAMEKHPTKTEVLVPEYICPSVVQTIENLGLLPVKVAVDKQLLISASSVESKLGNNCLAVLVAHMYSAIADTQAIKVLANRVDAIVIDDAAQRSGIAENGELIGHAGDIGLVSFAQAKTIVSGVKASGGIIFSHNKEFSFYFHNKYKQLPESPNRWIPMLHFCLAYLLSGRFKILDYYLQRVIQSIVKPIDYYQATRISKVDARIALEQYKSLSRRLEEVCQVLAIYKSSFSQLKTIAAPQLLSNTKYLSRLIVQTKSISPINLADSLKKKGVCTKMCYSDASRAFDGQNASGLIEIPLIGISPEQAKLIASELAQVERGLQT